MPGQIGAILFQGKRLRRPFILRTEQVFQISLAAAHGFQVLVRQCRVGGNQNSLPALPLAGRIEARQIQWLESVDVGECTGITRQSGRLAGKPALRLRSPGRGLYKVLLSTQGVDLEAALDVLAVLFGDVQ